MRSITPERTPQTVLIPLHQITIDPRLQMRAANIDNAFVDNLAEVLHEDREELDPITLYRDRAELKFWVADGHHRLLAYDRADRDEIPALVFQGGYEAAWLHALGANADQRTKPRTRADLRKAVRTALESLWWDKPEAERATQAQIAEICKTSQVSVSNILARMKQEREKAEILKPQEPAVPLASVPTGPQLTFLDQLFEHTEDWLCKVNHFDTDEFWEETERDPKKAYEEIDKMQAAIATFREDLQGIKAKIKHHYMPQAR